MLRTFRNLSIAAAALAALGVSALPAAAERATANLGPVAANEPILATIGDKRLVAYYERNGDTCEVSAVVFDASPNGGGETSTRVRFALHPGELFHLDNVADRRVVMTCGPNAAMLTILNQAELQRTSAHVY